MKRSAFTLIELLVATMISSFIALSLVAIYSTAHRHVFQTHRAGMVKSDMSIAMKMIRNAVGQANRIDAPANPGDTGPRLLVSSNIDQLTGCYPVNPNLPVSWQMFCLYTAAGETQLLAYSNTINTTCACPTTCGSVMPNFACGTPGNNQLRLARFIYAPSNDVFSRPNDPVAVNVKLRALWSAAAHGYGTTQQDVDYTLESVFSVNRAAR